MLIEVTKEDINNGQVGECRYCPVALAMNRATNKKWVVGNYTYNEITNVEGGFGFIGYFPREVTDWIFAFDKNGKAQPFSFELEI